MAAVTDPMPSALEKTQNITELLTSLITIGQTLSKDLSKHVSIKPAVGTLTTELPGNLNMVATVLESLQETYNTYHALLDEKASTRIMPLLLRSIQSAFSKIEKTLQAAIESENDHDWLEDNEAQKPGLDPRSRLNFFLRALGGVRNLLEDTCDSLAFLNSAFKYLAISAVKKEERDDSQNKEMRLITEHYSLDDVKWFRGELTELLRDAIDAEAQLRRPGNQRDPDFNFQIRPRVIKRDDDARSIASYDSFGSNQFIEAKELYEYWVFQRSEIPSRTRRSWSFLGLGVHETYDDTGYTYEAKARTQAFLKAKDEETRTEVEFREREKRIEETIAGMPQRFQVEILYLLQDRERITNNQRFVRKWEIVDIREEKPKIKTSATSWGAWWRGQGGTVQWGLIIKGTTTADIEEGERVNNRVPHRYQDPFRKYNYRSASPERRNFNNRWPEHDEVRVEPRPYRNNVYVPGRHTRVINRKVGTEEDYEKEIKEVFDELVELVERECGVTEKF